MLRKIITGTLVLIMLSTSSVVVYAGPLNGQNIDSELKIEKEERIEIISPQINPNEDVIAEKNLLISIKVIGDSKVTLNLYKILEDSKELELLSEEIEPNDELETNYAKNIKNIEPGKYKMVFKKDGEKKLKDIEFNVKKTKEVVNKEIKDSLPELLDLSITDLLLGE